MKGIAGKIGLIILILALFTGLASGCTETIESTTPTTSAPAVTTTPAATTTAAAATTTATTPAVTATTPATITVTDDYGRTVTIAKYPQRIISLSPANTEILFALGLDKRIVGVSDYSDYPEEAANKPSVGAYNEPNIEQVIALEPDLVVATEEHELAIEQLESMGIIVVAVNPTTVGEVLDTMTFLGTVTGQEDEAAALVSGIQTRIDAITAKTAALTDDEKPRVFVVIWHDPIWTVGSGTFHDELIRLAGGVNITGDLEGYTDISLEAVIDANPQVIIAGVGMGEGSSLSLDFMMTDERLAGTDARINDRVYGADMNIVSRPGPRLADALEIFFSLIHPEMQ